MLFLILKKEMKELLHLCTENLHFIFNGEIFIQIDGVTMGSPLGPILANIFMVELEKIIIPKLEREVKLWRRFVDDTICFAKMDSLNYILLTINSFHKNIKFTMEIEQNSTTPFLDVLLIRNHNCIS